MSFAYAIIEYQNLGGSRSICKNVLSFHANFEVFFLHGVEVSRCTHRGRPQITLVIFVHNHWPWFSFAGVAVLRICVLRRQKPTKPSSKWFR